VKPKNPGRVTAFEVDTEQAAAESEQDRRDHRRLAGDVAELLARWRCPSPSRRGSRSSSTSRTRERDLGPKEWPASGDFLLARVGGDGELVDLTEDDIRLWMFWLGLHYILKC
jgi:hypothetical protein